MFRLNHNQNFKHARCVHKENVCFKTMSVIVNICHLLFFFHVLRYHSKYFQRTIQNSKKFKKMTMTLYRFIYKCLKEIFWVARRRKTLFYLSECVLCCPLHILNKSCNGWGSTKIRLVWISLVQSKNSLN